MKRYKLALINPKGSFLGRNEKFIEFHKQFSRLRENWSGFNSGLLIVAALTPDSFEMKYIDENYEEIDYMEGFDLVCLSAMTQQATQAYQIADKFRGKGIKIVMGGIHATVMPEEAKGHVDAVVIGEAEDIWGKLLSDFTSNKLRPFYKADTAADLYKTPIPRLDLIKPENYRMVWVQTTRGCPWDCEFCVASNIYGKRYRYKEVAQVIKELNLIKDTYRGEIGFADDNMFVNKKYSTKLLEQISSLNIRWYAQSDISIGDDDRLLELLRKSGCSILLIGFESISKDNLNSLKGMNHKMKYVYRYPELIKKIQSYGIGIMGAFIVGLDGDNVSIFKNIADFITDNHLYSTQISALTPYPGTKLRERLLLHKKLLPTNWVNYTGFDVNFIPAKMSPNELEEGLVDIYRRVYAPEVRIRTAKHFKDIYLNLKKKRVQSADYAD